MLQGGPSGVTPGDALPSTTSASAAAVAPENAPGRHYTDHPLFIGGRHQNILTCWIVTRSTLKI